MKKQTNQSRDQGEERTKESKYRTKREGAKLSCYNFFYVNRYPLHTTEETNNGWQNSSSNAIFQLVGK